MKIVITQTELNDLFRNHYQIREEVTVMIEGLERPTLPDVCRNFIKAIRNLNPGPGNIIPAVKEIRAWIAPMTLSDAKWAVENFDKVEDFINKNHRLPIFLGRGKVGEMV